ncbi:MAG: MotA/TolQ/ExbB proton channel family protein [Gammaproteobacteria bacterium]|nr:MotA/TolQ/ExbB proton channel family protein [Gammaproteobacteria bacterium]MDE0487614.1 MotA/TolQ/ExbB proton channel family protein [Gammaproteobacteria bacterium]MXW20905.1 MotA/TolQ/ExbB proton channel family protein [Gammaproteobacteria bacterium]MXZ26691.1 MotA/TolQ/ExbB proton channel family protein [Gammaproteobacteria bacterium]MYF58732.1 MotA/TolQ/ExbB proton channel family protein [Gammaproteobacteria bacterium]
MRRQLPVEFVFQIFSLLLSVIIVHAMYVAWIRPQANAVIEEQRIMLEQDADYVPERSLYVIVRDFEQEACLILALWALAIMGYKARGALRERSLLQRDLLPLAEGVRILPEDTREHARQLRALPESQQRLLLPRVLLSALQRFGATGNVQDVSSATQTLVNAEAERLESELSMIRYIAWAIPSIGFIGTVRGIGQALTLAYRAVEGDISGVTESLGVAFNSTFFALLVSIIIMFLVHQLQLLQERLVFETSDYCDERLIRRLQGD